MLKSQDPDDILFEKIKKKLGIQNKEFDLFDLYFEYDFRISDGKIYKGWDGKETIDLNKIILYEK